MFENNSISNLKLLKFFSEAVANINITVHASPQLKRIIKENS
jgi:hypothetical protein